MWDWLIGAACSLYIAAAAYGKKSLSGSGAAAAVAVGTVMYAMGSLPWFGTLIVFFIASTALTKWRHRQKSLVESGYAKSGRRDAGQVLANGGLGAALCICHNLWPGPLWWVAFIGVMATVTADTWATEIGALSRTQPRSILNGRKVAAGTSGGVTALGAVASVAGGITIGLAAWLLSTWQPASTLAAENSAAAPAGAVLLLFGAAGGLVGSLSDSLLGAVWQVMYRCTVCGKEIEKDRHCNQLAVRIRGASWFTNDAVNIISSLCGGAACLILYLILYG
ncbi:DUF92 domain-containing protein [Paenibacillus xerothermodurans]|uniref:DUF92 domain-containing protein n=1 Tax=Paenibacillus xerothermodurans TaxID=1977292 RepID=A0A2W1NAL2_PAEXE|nr:DUF92 domain-containing protein [Paenibacillus xerothermodurans]PZE20984.1 DUF92 domain-containing protein [Paenibacillus xerothermodurans]